MGMVGLGVAGCRGGHGAQGLAVTPFVSKGRGCRRGVRGWVTTVREEGNRLAWPRIAECNAACRSAPA
jgi:hypothetical protein